MKTNRMILTAALLLAAGSITTASAKQWTLKECIDYALSNNISLAKSKLTKLSATEDLQQAKANLLPSLNFATNQSVGYRPWTNAGVATVSNGTVSSSVNKTYYNGSYSLNGSWTVWNGNKNRNNVKASELAQQTATLDSATTANSIQEQIVQLYVQILYTNEAITVNKESLEKSRANEKRGLEMVSIGKMSKADHAQLTAQTAQDEYNVVEAQSQLAKYKTQLKQLLEIMDEDFDITVPKASDDAALTAIPSLMSVYEEALATRPEIAASQLAIKSSDINLAIAKAGKAPTVSLSGGVGTSSNSMSDKGWGKQIKTNFDANVGATLSVPLFDNRSAKTAVNKAKIQQEESLLALKDKQKQLYSAIEGYWIDAQTNQQKFRSAMTNVESQEASYELLSEQFRLGLKNIVELMNGKTNLLTAQQNKLQAKYMTILDQQLLKFYKGEAINL